VSTISREGHFGPIAERHRPPTQSPLRFEAAILSRTRSR
jgi:hypothetical protein